MVSGLHQSWLCATSNIIGNTQLDSLTSNDNAPLLTTQLSRALEPLGDIRVGCPMPDVNCVILRTGFHLGSDTVVECLAYFVYPDFIWADSIHA
jgi:hypothetical protein